MPYHDGPGAASLLQAAAPRLIQVGGGAVCAIEAHPLKGLGSSSSLEAPTLLSDSNFRQGPQKPI